MMILIPIMDIPESAIRNYHGDSSIADISKSETFESDNDANGSTLTPQTGAVYSNITIVGPRAT